MKVYGMAQKNHTFPSDSVWGYNAMKRCVIKFSFSQENAIKCFIFPVKSEKTIYSKIDISCFFFY